MAQNALDQAGHGLGRGRSGFVYLTAVVDWFSRRVLAWRVSITMEAEFFIEALEEALAKLPSKHLQMQAYLSAEAPLMALQKMPIGAALGWRPARRFTQIVFVPALDGLS